MENHPIILHAEEEVRKAEAEFCVSSNRQVSAQLPECEKSCRNSIHRVPEKYGQKDARR
jgi:hypothetical protein